jgi:hypothetical protein
MAFSTGVGTSFSMAQNNVEATLNTPYVMRLSDSPPAPPHYLSFHYLTLPHLTCRVDACHFSARHFNV